MRSAGTSYGADGVVTSISGLKAISAKGDPLELIKATV
jgi:hypothetical protein